MQLIKQRHFGGRIMIDKKRFSVFVVIVLAICSFVTTTGTSEPQMAEKESERFMTIDIHN